MEVCKNKSSGQYFIYIDKSGDDQALMITPDAKVKLLKLDLFGEIEEDKENILLQNNLIKVSQVHKFHEYKESRSEEVVDLFEYYFEKKSPSEKEALIQKLQMAMAAKK